MVRGSCLCGGVRFEVDRVEGPFELCHCSRCRKVSGSGYLTWLGVRGRDFRFVQGLDLVQTYECPVRDAPPPYDTAFCRRCGSQLPNPAHADDDYFEIPAGALDDDPGIRPDKHIYVAFKAPWDRIMDDLPRMSGSASEHSTAASALMRFPSAVPRSPAVDAWLAGRPGPLGEIAREWFAVLRACGDDVRELLHDGHPTACIGDAAFAYVNAFRDHVNVGFYRGADLPDPAGLLEGTGKYMRHVKVWPDRPPDAAGLKALIAAAYADMQRRVLR